MQISAEVRWFWHAAPPARFKDWFLSDGAHPYRAGGGKTRPDDYLYDPSQVELGIKARGGKAGTEIKGLVAQFPNAVPDGPFKGDGELWTKWTSNALRIDSLPRLLTNKTRALKIRRDRPGSERDRAWTRRKAPSRIASCSGLQRGAHTGRNQRADILDPGVRSFRRSPVSHR